MAIKRYDVSNDREVYEAWPDLILTKEGKLICIFCECKHHGDRSYSKIVYTESLDKGETWSEKKALTEPLFTDGKTCWDCPRISQLKDGRLAVLCNHCAPDVSEIYMWFGDGEGNNWTEPVTIGAYGIVPDKLLETSSGRMIISCHKGNDGEFEKLTQRLWYSDDLGKTWNGPVTVAADARYNLCEGSILEVSKGVLLCFLRENSSIGMPCVVTRSEDDGLTWGEVYTIPLACCHRPVSGFLDTGEIMITYRHQQSGRNFWLGKWTQNTFLAITDKASVLTADVAAQWTRIMPLNYDQSEEADLGYTGWVQFPDGMIYIVDYMRGEEKKCHIVGASMYRSDISKVV